jgi:hypothetical protein
LLLLRLLARMKRLLTPMKGLALPHHVRHRLHHLLLLRWGLVLMLSHP